MPNLIHQRMSEHTKAYRPNAAAFTLMEMLVVIGVIGILASLLLGANAALTGKKIHARVNTELAALQTAINSYKVAKGFYPPDNIVPNATTKWGPVTNVTQPPLFYELTGTVIGNPDYQSVFDPNHRLAPADVKSAFGVGGFLNSDTDPKEVKNFYPNLKPSIVASNSAGLLLLVVPYKGPRLSGEARDFNPWRYNSSHPTNNVGEYDLWAEVIIGVKTNIISNWKQ